MNSTKYVQYVREYIYSCIKKSGTCHIAIDKPGYHRSLDYFAKISKVDVFLSMDILPYTSRSLQNRQVFYYNDALRRLTIPVRTAKSAFSAIKIDSYGSLMMHRAVISTIYSATPYFSIYSNMFAEIYRHERVYLIDLCDAITNVYLQSLGVDTLCVRISNLPYMKLDNQENLLLDVLTKLVGKELLKRITYVVGSSSAKNLYMDNCDFLSGIAAMDTLRQAGLHIGYYTFSHPAYNQRQYWQGDRCFIPNLACIDLLSNYGTEAGAVLRSACN